VQTVPKDARAFAYHAGRMSAPRPSNFSFTRVAQSLRNAVAALMPRRNTRIADGDGLRRFIETRANYVAQTSLYGYLRTRAGTRYPYLFEDDGFMRSVNIAKWHVWLACVADLSVFAGGLLLQREGGTPERFGRYMSATVDALLEAVGVPADAGPEYAAHAQRVRARLQLCNWPSVADDRSAFSESEPALVYWSPVADELKRHDVVIVSNSIRFLWQEVRRELRRDLDAAAIMAASA